MSAFLKPFPTHGAGVPSVTTMDPEDVSFHVTIPSKQFQANATSVFVTNVQVVNLRIIEMLLVLMGLEHHTTFDGLVTLVTRVRCVEVFVIGRTREVVNGLGQDLILLVAGSASAPASTSPAGAPFLALLARGSHGQRGGG